MIKRVEDIKEEEQEDEVVFKDIEKEVDYDLIKE